MHIIHLSRTVTRNNVTMYKWYANLMAVFFSKRDTDWEIEREFKFIYSIRCNAHTDAVHFISSFCLWNHTIWFDSIRFHCVSSFIVPKWNTIKMNGKWWASVRVYKRWIHFQICQWFFLLVFIAWKFFGKLTKRDAELNSYSNFSFITSNMFSVVDIVIMLRFCGKCGGIPSRSLLCTKHRAVHCDVGPAIKLASRKKKSFDWKL